MQRKLPIALLALGQTLVWATIYYVFPAFLLRWEQDTDWTKAELTAAIMLAVFVSALAAPLVGGRIDRGHGAQTMGAAAVLGGCALIALSQVTEPWQFYGLWGVLGLSFAGCLYEPCFAIVTRVRGGLAKPAIILITLAAGFASTLSFPINNAVADAFGWRMALVATGTFTIGIVAPILAVGVRLLEREGVPDGGAPDAEDAQAAGARDFLNRPTFWFLASGFACAAVVHGATLHHLLPFLDEKGLSADMAVLVASFIGPMQVAGRLAMMASERAISTHGVAIAAFACMGTSVALLLLGGGQPAALIGFTIFFGGAYGTVSILRPTIAREILGGRNFGVKSGALALPYLVGSATAPYLGALSWGVGGYDLMLSLLLLLSAIGCALYLAARKASQWTVR
ncbi:MAG: MFS transporter [Pseudomonadota bacterium]